MHLPVFTIVWALGVWLGWADGFWRSSLFQVALSALLLVPLVEFAHRWIELPMIARGKDVAKRLHEAIAVTFGANASRTA
ncbi:hypothetical protein EGT07_33145 [Herbaspirillum sp. HC18]|nr:hypothetical protein EGT07_33145 [Herbaspirillum sp. HC18]